MSVFDWNEDFDPPWEGWPTMFSRRRPEPPDHYFECRLLPVDRKSLIAMLEGKPITDLARQQILVRVKAAPRYDIPAVEVDWHKAEREAKKRGESVAEWIADAPWELKK